MHWLRSLWARRGARRSLRDVEQLGEFLSRHAAFIAQKCADDYCRNKVGLSHYALSEERTYNDALRICRWEGYAAMLAGLTTVVQRMLLEAGFDATRTEQGLVALYGRLLAQHPVPSHRPEGWADLVAALPARLSAARAEPAPSLAEIAAIAGRRLFQVLPLHSRYREHDEPVVIGAVQFNFVGVSDRLRRELDAVAVGRALTGAS